MYRTWVIALRKYMRDQGKQRVSKNTQDVFRHAFILGYCAAKDKQVLLRRNEE